MAKKDERYKDTIGYRIKELRKKCKLTQEEVARECIMSRPTIGKYESNQANVKAEFIDRFIALINKTNPSLVIAPEYLIDEKYKIQERQNVSINKELGLDDDSIKAIQKITSLGLQPEFLEFLQINNLPKLFQTLKETKEHMLNNEIPRLKELAKTYKKPVSHVINEELNKLISEDKNYAVSKWFVEEELRACTNQILKILFRTTLRKVIYDKFEYKLDEIEEKCKKEKKEKMENEEYLKIINNPEYKVLFYMAYVFPMQK